MILGDLTFVAGAIGLFIYMCLIVVKHTNRAGQMAEKKRRYQGENDRLRLRRKELKIARDELNPQVDEVMVQMIALRDERDRLQLKYEEIVETARTRVIQIKTKRMK